MVTAREQKLTTLNGLLEALCTKKNAPAPTHWPDISAQLRKSDDAELSRVELALSVRFGDDTARGLMRTQIVDVKASSNTRLAALATLLDVKDKQLPETLFGLLKEPALRSG